MGTISNTVIDQHGRPVAAAQVWIRDDEGALADTGGANPVITDAEGDWSAYLEPGTYSLVIMKGDDFISRGQTVCVTDEDVGAGRFIVFGYVYFDSSAAVLLQRASLRVFDTVQIP